jgi:hypothetical protein
MGNFKQCKIYKFNVIATKIPMAFFHRNKKSKINLEPKSPQLTRAILRKKTRLEEQYILTLKYTTKL